MQRFDPFKIRRYYHNSQTAKALDIDLNEKDENVPYQKESKNLSHEKGTKPEMFSTDDVSWMTGFGRKRR